MNIIIKVARGKSIINFKFFNHKVDRAVTMKELMKKVSTNEYDLVLFEEIDKQDEQKIKNISSIVRTALVCGREKEYAQQVELANSIGIDVIAQSGEIDDYIKRNTGESIKFTGNGEDESHIGDIEEYDDSKINKPVVAEDDEDDENVNIVVEDDTDEVERGLGKIEENIPVISENDSEVERVVQYALGEEHKSESKDATEVTVEETVVAPILSGASSDEIEKYLDEIEQLKRQSADFIKDIDRLTKELADAEELKTQYSGELETTKSELGETQIELSNAKESVNQYIAKVGEQANEIAKHLDTIESLNEKIETLQSSLNSETSDLTSEKNALIEELKGIKEELKETLEKYNKLISKIISLRGKVIESYLCFTSAENIGIDAETSDFEVILDKAIDIMDKFSDIWNENVRVKGELGSAKGIEDSLNKQISEQEIKIKQLTEEVSAKSDLITDKENEIERQKNIINGFEETKRKEIEDTANDLKTARAEAVAVTQKFNMVNSQLVEKEKYISELSKQVINLEKEASEQSNKIKSLENELYAAKLSANSVSGGTVSMSRGYNGSAKIIQVFGSGSYGITTVAMTIAHRFINKRVLFIDLDLVSPKADGWFGINPVCDGLVDIQDTINKTGVAALVNNGTPYVIRNFDKIVKHKIKQRDYVLDYFSGIYNTPQSSKIYSIDYTMLFSYLSDMYDYIVVDSGRIGSSDAYDSVIRTINDMAYKNVIVTSSDKYDIRTQKVKMDYTNIDLSKSIWVANLADTNVISPEIKKLTGGIKLVQLVKVLNYYGMKKPMDIAVPMVKPKIDEIMRFLA